MWSMAVCLPFGLLDIIGNALKKVFEAIFGSALVQWLLKLIAEFALIVAEILWDFIVDVLRSVFFFLLLGLLRIVDMLESCFNIFAGISTIRVNGVETTLHTMVFTESGVTGIFWGIALIACVLLVVFTAAGLLRSAADLEGKRTVGRVMGSAGKAGLTFLLVPVLGLAAIEMASWVLIKTGEIVDSVAGVTTGTVTMGNYIFGSIIQEAVEKSNESIALGFFNGSQRYETITQVPNYLTLENAYIYTGIIISLLIMVFLIMGAFIFIRRLFELILLFITAPYFVSAMPLDNGQKFNQWRDMFLGKLVAGFGMAISIKIYLLIVPLIMNSGVVFFESTYSNSICKLVFLAGGAFAAYKSHGMLTQIVSFSASQSENETGAIMGGMILGAAARGGGSLMHKMMPGHRPGPVGMGGSGGAGGGAGAAAGSGSNKPEGLRKPFFNTAVDGKQKTYSLNTRKKSLDLSFADGKNTGINYASRNRKGTRTTTFSTGGGKTSGSISKTKRSGRVSSASFTRSQEGSSGSISTALFGYSSSNTYASSKTASETKSAAPAAARSALPATARRPRANTLPARPAGRPTGGK